jgi:type I restriction enzyme M protein
MLSKETKKKIDDARDILVGQLPLPSDQVELITIALIYKFMDDQDEDLRQLGFDEVFFSGDLKQYSWQRLMSNEIDADERVSTFTKGIEEIQKAEHIPQLFREIFKNTFLKFRDGRTLHLFLKVINGFSYDHSEELGNAFEYLLMSMGAQGENGQFRTPRNIIDFIVEVVDPDKSDTILDPACGTGGFLLSAFKHILRKYTTGMEHYRITLNNEDIEGIPVNWGDKLTSQDLRQLGVSIEGYDITPQMTRLAKVNLYLHQFKSPRIHEYDTLTSEGRWKDKYDCILANPPFMTPKGGVSTHSKFRIRASKAEVLFSDYILEHLTPDGMAGFIVPEGIIFQNSGDYVELRKWLVNGAGLWAVVSLPAQIFQPYSGVKTSILFIDRKVARSRDEIILVKVENDGYSLNTNRAATARNDLPEALNLLTIGKKSLDELREYLDQNSGKQDMPQALIKPRSEFARLDAYKAQSSAFNLIRKQYEKCLALEEEIKSLPPADQEGLGEKEKKTQARLQSNLNKLAAEFSKITGTAYTKISLPLQSYFDDNLKEAVIAYGADSTKVGGLSTHLRDYLDGHREYSLSFDKYAGENGPAVSAEHEMVLLGDVCSFEYGKPLKEENRVSGDCPVYGSNGIVGYHNDFLVEAPFIVVGRKGSAGSVHFSEKNGYPIDTTFFVKLANENSILLKYLYQVLQKLNLKDLNTQAGVPGLNRNDAYQLQIPLPPIEIQKQIVAEIEAYQKVVDGCNLIVENFKSTFVEDESWERVSLSEACSVITDGTHYKPEYTSEGYKFLSAKNVVHRVIDWDNIKYIDEKQHKELQRRVSPRKYDILLAKNGTTGVAAINETDEEFDLYVSLALLRPKSTLDPYFLLHSINSELVKTQFNSRLKGVGVPNLHLKEIKEVIIPLPPLETQQKIVAELEEDLAAVAGAKRLKAKMEANIRATICRVWGEKK